MTASAATRNAARRLGLAACAHTVRSLDPAHYLCATFLAPEARARALALYALNCELDRVVATSTKAHFARAKLAWWGNAIDSVCRGKRKRSVGDALAAATREDDEGSPAAGADDHAVLVSLRNSLVGGSDRSYKYLLPKIVREKARAEERPLSVAKNLDALERHCEAVVSRIPPLPPLPLRVLRCLRAPTPLTPARAASSCAALVPAVPDRRDGLGAFFGCERGRLCRLPPRALAPRQGGRVVRAPRPPAGPRVCGSHPASL